MTDVKRVIFLGSFNLGRECLEYLFSCPEVRVVGILTTDTEKNRYENLRRLARESSVPLLEKEEEISELKPDLGFSVHYIKIIPRRIIECFKMGIVNLHPGPLPEYRGSFPFVHAICDGRTGFGSSIHFINEKIDAGPLICRSDLEIKPDMTSWQLFEKTEELLYNDFVRILPDLLSGNIHAVAQDEIIKKTGVYPKTFTRIMLEEKRKIDLSWPEEKIYNHVRAFHFPGLKPAYATISGKPVYLRISP